MGFEHFIVRIKDPERKRLTCKQHKWIASSNHVMPKSPLMGGESGGRH